MHSVWSPLELGFSCKPSLNKSSLETWLDGMVGVEC